LVWPADDDSSKWMGWEGEGTSGGLRVGNFWEGGRGGDPVFGFSRPKAFFSFLALPARCQVPSGADYFLFLFVLFLIWCLTQAMRCIRTEFLRAYGPGGSQAAVRRQAAGCCYHCYCHCYWGAKRWAFGGYC
jgi:hypothetical protein